MVLVEFVDFEVVRVKFVKVAAAKKKKKFMGVVVVVVVVKEKVVKFKKKGKFEKLKFNELLF